MDPSDSGHASLEETLEPTRQQELRQYLDRFLEEQVDHKLADLERELGSMSSILNNPYLEEKAAEYGLPLKTVEERDFLRSYVKQKQQERAGKPLSDYTPSIPAITQPVPEQPQEQPPKRGRYKFQGILSSIIAACMGVDCLAVGGGLIIGEKQLYHSLDLLIAAGYGLATYGFASDAYKELVLDSNERKILPYTSIGTGSAGLMQLTQGIAGGDSFQLIAGVSALIISFFSGVTWATKAPAVSVKKA